MSCAIPIRGASNHAGSRSISCPSVLLIAVKGTRPDRDDRPPPTVLSCTCPPGGTSTSCAVPGPEGAPSPSKAASDAEVTLPPSSRLCTALWLLPSSLSELLWIAFHFRLRIRSASAQRFRVQPRPLAQ